MPQKAPRGKSRSTVAPVELSIRAYAEHRRRLGLAGATKAAVEKALATGRIKRTESGKIDPAAADAAWGLNTAPRPGSAQPRQDAPPPPAAQDHATISDYQRNRAEREYFLRKSAELEYMEEAGQLVRVEQVKEEYFRLARMARSALEAVPAKVAPSLVGLHDVSEIQRLVREEIRRALSSLRDG